MWAGEGTLVGADGQSVRGTWVAGELVAEKRAAKKKAVVRVAREESKGRRRRGVSS